MTKPIKTAFFTLLMLCAAWPALALKRIELVPQDARMSARISDTIRFLDQLKKSSLGRLWADPQFQAFLGNPDKDVWMELFADGDVTASDEMMLEQIKMLKGEVIMAFSEEYDDPFMIMNMSREDFERSLVLDERMSESLESPFDIVRTSFQDTEVIQHISEAGTPLESRTWQAFCNGTVVLGPSREWLERSIVQLQKDTVDEPGGNPVFEINVPLASLIHQRVEEVQSDEMAAASELNIRALFEALGVMGVEKYTAQVELRDDEMVVDSNLLTTEFNKGLFSILNTDPVELPSVNFIPENITMIEAGRMNLLRFWQEIPVVLAAVMPEVKPQYDMLLAMIRQQLGVDLEQDLLAHLGTRYIGYTVFEGDLLVTVLALELQDGAAFKQGLEAIINAPMMKAQIDSAIDTVDFLNHNLYVSKSAEPSDAFAFAVSGNYLLYGHPSGVRQAIRNLSGEAAGNTRYEQTELVQGLRRYVPDSAFGYSAVDWNKNMAFIIHELTRPEIMSTIQQQWAMSGSPLPPPDFDKLPPTDHLASFFNIAYQYLEKTRSGLHHQMTIKY